MAFLTELAQGDQAVYLSVLIAIMRYLGPAIMLVLLFRCIWPMITFRKEPEIWAWLCLEDDTRLPITHWESVIGTNKHSDIVIDDPKVSPNHAVLTRYDDGSWSVTDADSKTGVYVNGQRVTMQPLQPEDVITVGSLNMELRPISKKQEQHMASLRTKASSFFTSLANVLPAIDGSCMVINLNCRIYREMCQGCSRYVAHVCGSVVDKLWKMENVWIEGIRPYNAPSITVCDRFEKDICAACGDFVKMETQPMAEDCGGECGAATGCECAKGGCGCEEGCHHHKHGCKNGCGCE